MPLTDYYAALGVDSAASAEEIRRAFRARAIELHPDANPSGGSARLFQEAKEAYDVLRVAESRLAYDARRALRRGVYDVPAEDAEALRERAEAFRRRYQNPEAAGFQRRSMHVVEALFRPRVLLLLPFIALGSWFLARQLSPPSEADAEGKVIAWFNPASRRWETPAPWSALYHENRHTLKLVPRDSVALSMRPRDEAGPEAPLR